MKYLFLACLLFAACDPLASNSGYIHSAYPDFAMQAAQPPPRPISCRSFFEGRHIICQ